MLSSAKKAELRSPLVGADVSGSDIVTARHTQTARERRRHASLCEDTLRFSQGCSDVVKRESVRVRKLMIRAIL